MASEHDAARPRRFYGHKPARLTPNEFAELTSRPSAVTELFDPDWGLDEVHVNVTKKGIALYGRQFVALELIKHTKERVADLGSTVVARYDKAEAASGRLEEIRVYEVLDDNSYRFVAEAYLPTIYRELFPSKAARLAERFAHEDALYSDRDWYETAARRLENPEAHEQTENEIEALKRGTPHSTVYPPTPMYAGEEEELEREQEAARNRILEDLRLQAEEQREVEADTPPDDGEQSTRSSGSIKTRLLEEHRRKGE